MTTITLIQAAAHDATRIHTMTAQPMGIRLSGLTGGAIQFTCTNALAAIRHAKEVQITYNGNLPQQHQTIQVSSVQA